MSDHIPRKDVTFPPTVSEAKLMDRIEELDDKLSKSKALLAKAMKALAQIGKTYTADKNRLIHGDLQIIEMVQTTLAELNGEDRG